MADRFNEIARRALGRAYEEAHSRHHTSVRGEHLVLAILTESRGLVQKCLASIDVDDATLREKIDAALAELPSDCGFAGKLEYEHTIEEAMTFAAEEARMGGREWTNEAHVLVGLSRIVPTAAATALERAGVRTDALRSAVATAQESHVPLDSPNSVGRCP